MDRPLVKSGELLSRHSGNFVASPLPSAIDDFEPRGLQDEAANITKLTNPPIAVTKVSPLFGRAHNFQTWWSTSGHGPRSGSQNTGCEHVPAQFCHFHVSNENMELLFGGAPAPFCHVSNFSLEPETTFRSSPHAIRTFFRFSPLGTLKF